VPRLFVSTLNLLENVQQDVRNQKWMHGAWTHENRESPNDQQQHAKSPGILSHGYIHTQDTKKNKKKKNHNNQHLIDNRKGHPV